METKSQQIPKVSIIIPVFNTDKYVRRCFESVAAQTYINIECFFVDDCSTDNSRNLIRDLIDNYQGPVCFKLIELKQNKGASCARNMGLRACDGDYVFYLDSDDEITPDAIECLVAVTHEHEDVDLVQGNTQTIPQPENDWRNISSKNFPDYTDNHDWISKQMLIGTKGISMNACNKLLRRDFLFKNELFFKEGIIFEDYHWIFYVAKCIKSISFSNHICMKHHIVSGSIMQSTGSYETLRVHLEIANDILEHIDSLKAKRQWKYLTDCIYNSMVRIEPNNKEAELIPGYHDLIRRILHQHNWSTSPVERALFLMLLKPKSTYRNSILGGILTRVLNRMSFS